jgi:16S rRNA (guanine527-N7)-methyltransferase
LVGGEASAHAPLLRDLGLDPSAASALARYLDLVAAWNPRVNLTGAHTPAERVAVLVAPVLPAAAGIEPGLLLDVGSGNGSPGLVLALLRPDIPTVLLEPRQRRWAFLREAARAAGRPDVDVRRARHDGYAGPPAQTLTVRALALPLRELAALVAPGGRLLVWGPAPTAGEGSFVVERPGPGPGIHALRRPPATGNVSRST